MKRISTKKNLQSVNRHMESCPSFIREALIDTRRKGKDASWLSNYSAAIFKLMVLIDDIHLGELHLKLNADLSLG